MARATTDSCTLTLPLRIEKWQEDKIEKRFEIARQIYNALVRQKMKKLLYYQSLPADVQKKDKRKLLNTLGLSEFGFKEDIKFHYKHFKDNIGSAVASQTIATQAWTAFEKVLYGKGKKVHFKKKGDICTLRGAANTQKEADGQYKSGGIEIVYSDGLVKWKGLCLPVKIDPLNAYETQMLSHRIKYCRILKKVGKNKNRYYVQLTLECKPVVKADPQTGEVRHPLGSGKVGLKLGARTLAYASGTECKLVHLAERVQSIEHEKWLIQRKMDRSRRATNPDCYAPNGTVIRGKKAANKSHRYERLQRKLAYLHAHQAEMRKLAHNELANHLLSLGDEFIMEETRVSAWSRKTEKTEISPKTGRYKRKKRFGESIANHAPAMLIAMVNTKLQSRGLPPVTIIPTALNATCFNHLTNTFEDVKSNRRWRVMPDGKKIYRDLYSAFLLRHVILPSTDTSCSYNFDTLTQEYPSFCNQHEEILAH